MKLIQVLVTDIRENTEDKRLEHLKVLFMNSRIDI
jgi:hypothetical protein